ncbi:MAG: hypothetical protein ACU837_02795 [Gammaproteobacteria bacterium]
MLAACAYNPNADLPDSKAFQFLQADIERDKVSESFARYLTEANAGTVVAINDGTIGKVWLGGKYYSAIGNVCRHFKVLGRNESDQVACFVNDGWRKGRAILSGVPAG